MMTEPARETSLLSDVYFKFDLLTLSDFYFKKNKHFRYCDYFAIIPSCSHFTMLTKNPATGFV